MASGDKRPTPTPTPRRRSAPPSKRPSAHSSRSGSRRPARLPSNRLSAAPSSKLPPGGGASASATASLHSLRELVSPNDLSVVFQPIVSLPQGTLFAYEALVRCSVPAYRSPPVLFEESVKRGCTGRLGRMIREIGVPLASGARLFVNVHPSELSEGWLVRPDDPIYAHDHDVFLEVTESTPMTHYDLCMNVLKEVCTRGGVFLVIDDLGAGYSNLKRIADLEPRIVKIDRELIAGLDGNRRQQDLVSSVVELCNRLGAKVVAEGIETQAECLAAIRAGAHYGQGYLFGRPSFPLADVLWPGVEVEPPPTRPSGRSRR